MTAASSFYRFNPTLSIVWGRRGRRKQQTVSHIFSDIMNLLSQKCNPDHTDELLWRSAGKWREVNQTLSDFIGALGPRLDQARDQAAAVKERLGVVNAFMTDLSMETCPWCPNPCCLSARIWFDFSDLVFLHLLGRDIPPSQPVTRRGQTCRYLGDRGCALPRLSRPWVCTWYLCPTQKTRLRQQNSASAETVYAAMDAVKMERKLMESEFIRMLA